jgi:hypothetical protein
MQTLGAEQEKLEKRGERIQIMMIKKKQVTNR